MISVRLVPADGEPAAPARPGQFLTVRLRPDPAAAPLLRTYSLSGAPNAESYRISVKREPHGAASELPARPGCASGDVIEAGAPRGSFVLQPGDRPVVLISAGVGATPVLAMLHVLAAEPSARPVWWRARRSQRFRAPVQRTRPRPCSAQLPDAHRIVCYSHPRPQDRNFDVAGRVTADVLDQAGVPADADFYLCGPAPFMHDVAAALTARGGAPEPDQHGDLRPGRPDHARHRRRARARRRIRRPAQPGPGPLISFSRSNLSVAWDPAFPSLLELAEACDVPVRCQLPERRLPHVRDRAGQRRGQLPARPARAARAGQRAHLLLPARRRSHARSLAPTPPLPAPTGRVFGK